MITYIIASTYRSAVQFCKDNDINLWDPLVRIILQEQDLKGYRFHLDDRIAYVPSAIPIPTEVLREINYLETISAKPKRWGES